MLLARRQAMGFEWTKVRQGESAVDRAGGSFKFWTWLSRALHREITKLISEKDLQ